jgi:predicted RNA-binding Zn-ribbon protein involved in translation (DUF1610 family)
VLKGYVILLIYAIVRLLVMDDIGYWKGWIKRPCPRCGNKNTYRESFVPRVDVRTLLDTGLNNRKPSDSKVSEAEFYCNDCGIRWVESAESE